MEINVDKYLSEEDKKRIAEDVFREKCSKKFEKDHERLISNAGYEVVTKIIKAHYPENLESLVANKAIEVIDKLSVHTLFSPKDAWDRETTGGFEALKAAIENNKDLINEKAVGLIKSCQPHDAQDYIIELIRETVEKRLFGETK